MVKVFETFQNSNNEIGKIKLIAFFVFLFQEPTMKLGKSKGAMKKYVKKYGLLHISILLQI